GPREPHVAMFPTNRYSLPHSGQVFKGECLVGYGDIGGQGLADTVVSVSRTPALPASMLLESTPCALRANLLQSLASCMVAVEYKVNRGATTSLSVAVSCQIPAAKALPSAPSTGNCSGGACRRWVTCR